MCPLSLRTFHQKVVDGKVPPGIRGIQLELKLGDCSNNADAGTDNNGNGIIVKGGGHDGGDDVTEAQNGKHNAAVAVVSRPRRGLMSVKPAWMTAVNTTETSSSEKGTSTSTTAAIKRAAQQFEKAMRDKEQTRQLQKQAELRASKQAQVWKTHRSSCEFGACYLN